MSISGSAVEEQRYINLPVYHVTHWKF